MVEPARPQFVLFGSSIVQLSFCNGGWGSILSDIYSRKIYCCEITTGGISRRAVQVLDQVFPKDAAIQPSLVIVYFGGNESMGAHPSGLGPHVPLPEYVENTRKIAIHLKSLSDTIRIIFLTCPPVDENRVRQGTSGILSELVRTNELCKRYSDACIKLCQELGVKVVDLFTALQQKDGWMTACFTTIREIQSDAAYVDLRSCVGDRTIGKMLLSTFQMSYKENLTKAHAVACTSASKFLTVLTKEETNLYALAQSSMAAFKKLQIGGPIFQRASVLGRKW